MSCSGNPWLSAMSLIYKRFNTRKGNPVPFRYVSAALILSLAALLAPSGSVRADTLLYNNAGFIEGQQSFVQSFAITTPGTLTVTLSNIPWMDAIAGLNCFLTTSKGLMGPETMSSGSESINVQPGMIYAHWYGDANGPFGIGVYGLKIAFEPNGGVPVGLPKSLILMLSGLGLLFGWQRRAAPTMAAAA